MRTCPHCGYETEATGTCPLCGAHLERRARSADREARPTLPPAWEDPGVGFPHDLLRTWRRSVLEPSGFFPAVPWDAPAARPILYYLIVSIVGGFFALWWTAVFSATLFPTIEVFGIRPPRGSGGATALIEFFLTPFTAMLALVAWSLLVHLFVLALARERRSLGATFRALCYSAGPLVLNAVPILGGIVGSIWMLALSVLGIREAHRTTTGTAVVIVGLALFLPLLFAVAFVVIVAAALSAGA